MSMDYPMDTHSPPGKPPLSAAPTSLPHSGAATQTSTTESQPTLKS